MALPPFAASTLTLEARALLSRLDQVKPFAMIMPRVSAAAVSPEAAMAIDQHLIEGRRDLRRRVHGYLRWLKGPGREVTPAEAQRRFSMLRLRFNAGLTQLDIFADALTLRAEHENGTWLGGLDVAADDALELLAPFFDPPPVVTYLDRGQGAAIRRARTRLPGGGENPVALVRIPRERMVGSGIASSLVHEVGHQGAALLDLVNSLRTALRERQRLAQGDARQAWQLWDRWISEIVADFWAMAKVGIAATQGLMAVVSLPRAFVFRIQLDDPHPFPWVRVKLSAATGAALYPHPQWAAFDHLWESFYPREGLDPGRLRIIEALEATMPAFVRLLIDHRPKALRGKKLVDVFPIPERQPARLQALFEAWKHAPQEMRNAAPTLVFAVLGQAKQDRKLSPHAESETVGDLLNRWALRRALRKPGVQLPTTKAKAA
ncbi:MAG TPA: hypothetical protein VH394_21955 [Thermoanaerobaculia bacterium]|jgi:hypothetical protein|nr:hypothetical protein [Thermoanaerobaculia bacterium]